MAKTRRSYKGGAISTTTGTSIAASGTTSFTIAAYTGWPYGSDPFFVVLEPGAANEEKMLVTRAGSTDTTVSVYSTPTVAANRGLDGTLASAHNSGSTVYPVFTATDADEANELASTLTTKGDILTHSSTTFTRVGVGTNDYVLTADSSQTAGIKWGQVQTAGIANDAVTAAKIATGAVGSDELAANAVTFAKMVDAAPRGIVAYQSSTSSDNTVTSEELEMTSSSFTAVANRYYKITYFEPLLASTDATAVISMRIRTTNISGTVLNRSYVVNTSGNVFSGTVGIVIAVSTFSAGSVTLVGTLQCSAGTGNAGRTSENYGFIMVEDVGAVI